ncbi:hypothetical protein BJF96_g9430 [Verticillium dahliae]|uniref:Uncharacterized protein n=1 Tax=Verticillium dahliae TaxID=27337 RepID=A0AA45AHU7_VERDA|nr:hypothetical protein BJF96_g9430 [Verticillium dahliae]
MQMEPSPGNRIVITGHPAKATHTHPSHLQMTMTEKKQPQPNSATQSPRHRRTSSRTFHHTHLILMSISVLG